MVRPPREFREAAKGYVCVRVTNINRVDLSTFVFDHDLTLAIVLANPDGTVYHRYGGRTTISPMNMESLVEIMKDGLATHRVYVKAPHPPKPQSPLYLEELVQERLQGRINPVFGCYHCHYAREAEQYLAMEVGKWTPDQYWIYPQPDRLGLVMDQKRQNLVRNVLPKSPAEAAGVRAGDLLLRLDGSRILTKYDIQWILHERDSKPARLSFALRRQGRLVEGELELQPEWKVGDPNDYAWRVRNVYTEHMAKFLPTPGFVGERLPDSGLISLGLPETRFALKIKQLNAGTHLAGIRIGDVVLSAGGKSDFETVRDFHAWCESLRHAGRDIRMTLYRQGAEMNVMVPLSSLNYSKVEKAPRAVLGFIVQQLSGGAGLRVGHVTDGCSAERAGLQIGDRITRMEGKRVASHQEALNYLNNKAPGDLFTIDVSRDGKPLQFGFVLSGEEERRSEVARLTEPVVGSGQELTCVVRIELPEGKHVYSMHREGFGVPTQLNFRGRGYELVGAAKEPDPAKVEAEGLEPMWILEGEVEFRQRIRVTDAERFQLLLQVYAQVCDEEGCHEFRAVVGSDGSEGAFSEYHGRFEQQPEVGIGTSAR